MSTPHRTLFFLGVEVAGVLSFCFHGTALIKHFYKLVNINELSCGVACCGGEEVECTKACEKPLPIGGKEHLEKPFISFRCLFSSISPSLSFSPGLQFFQLSLKTGKKLSYSFIVRFFRSLPAKQEKTTNEKM